MKKIILAAAIAALAVSCSKSENIHTNDFVQSENTIKLNTVNDKVDTKAANDTNSNYTFAALLNSSDEMYILDQVDGKTDQFLYDGFPTGTVHEWPAAGEKLDIIAYAPSTTNIVKDATSAGSAVRYTVPTTADEDFTFSRRVIGSRENFEGGVVNLQFDHLLARITVNVSLSQELINRGYSIDNNVVHTLTFTPLANSFENFWQALSLGEALNNEESYFNIYNLTQPVFYNNTGIATAVRPQYQGKNDYYFMPQSAVGNILRLNNVKIDRTINGTKTTHWQGDLQNHIIKAGEISDANSGNTGYLSTDLFESGYHYVLNLVLGADSRGDDGNDEDKNPDTDGDGNPDTDGDGDKDDDGGDDEYIFRDILLHSTKIDWEIIKINTDITTTPTTPEGEGEGGGDKVLD